MSKSKDTKKSVKKEPSKTPKEKKEAKKQAMRAFLTAKRPEVAKIFEEHILWIKSALDSAACASP